MGDPVVATTSARGVAMQTSDPWTDDITATLASIAPVARPDLGDDALRNNIQFLFSELYVNAHGALPAVDLNIAYLEDSIVTCLGKLDTVFPYIFRFGTANKLVSMKYTPAGGTELDIQETATHLPIKSYSNQRISVKRYPKSRFLRFFHLLAIDFQVKTRRHLEMILSSIIVRVARRQDILFGKPITFTLGGGQDHKLVARYTPLFRCSQTYKRFRPLIQNHCGIGVKLQLLLSSDATNMNNAKKRVMDCLVHQDQRDFVETMSAGAGRSGISTQWIELFLESCYVMRPREGMSFIPSWGYSARTSQAVLEAFNTFYETAFSVLCGKVPFWYIELLTMTGTYYDNLGVMEHLCGAFHYRRDFSLTGLKLIPPIVPAVSKLNPVNFLKPLKGSAGTHPGSSKQTNTVITVHGQREVHDDCSWMKSSVSWAPTTDVYAKLRRTMEQKITDNAQGEVVCSYDTTINFREIGFWTD